MPYFLREFDTFKEALMKYFIKYLVTIAVVVLASTSLFAKPTKRIFPDYTGIQPKLINKAIAIYTYPDEYAALMTYVKDKNIRVVGQNNDWYKIILDGETKTWGCYLNLQRV